MVQIVIILGLLFSGIGMQASHFLQLPNNLGDIGTPEALSLVASQAGSLAPTPLSTPRESLDKGAKRQLSREIAEILKDLSALQMQVENLRDDLTVEGSTEKPEASVLIRKLQISRQEHELLGTTIALFQEKNEDDLVRGNLLVDEGYAGNPWDDVLAVYSTIGSILLTCTVS